MNTNNQNQEKPDLNEWRKQNPEMTLNDYFKIFGTTTDTSNTNNYSNEYEFTKLQYELNQKKSNPIIWPYIFTALFILIAFLSNPKIEDHRETLRIELNGGLEKVLSEETENLIQYGIQKTIGASVINEALKNVSSDNYLLFSLTKFNYASNSKIIGFGVLGKVYISKKVNRKIFKDYKNN